MDETRTTPAPQDGGSRPAPRGERTDPRARHRARALRWGILLGILGVSTALGILHLHPLPGFRTPPVDAFCPFGGLESLWSVARTGIYVRRVAASSFVLLTGTLAVTALVGRGFCGQFCALGTLQEAFARLGIRFAKRRMTMPAWIDRPARYLKYVVLVAIVFSSWRVGELVIRPYDPWAAYHHLTSSELLTGFGVGLAVLGATLAGSLGYDRFFCKYACPMGAFLGLLNRAAFFKVRRDSGACIDCGACDKACPVNLEIATRESVTSAECIACGECVNACPAEGALRFANAPCTRTLGPRAITLGTLAVIVGMVVATTVAGAFTWTRAGSGGGDGGGGGKNRGGAAARAVTTTARADAPAPPRASGPCGGCSGDCGACLWASAR